MTGNGGEDYYIDNAVRTGSEQMNFLQQMNSLRTATNEARARTGDDYIATHADAGKVQVVRAVPAKGGRFDIKPLSAWVPAADAVAFLQGM